MEKAGMKSLWSVAQYGWKVYENENKGKAYAPQPWARLRWRTSRCCSAGERSGVSAAVGMGTKEEVEVEETSFQPTESSAAPDAAVTLARNGRDLAPELFGITVI